MGPPSVSLLGLGTNQFGDKVDGDAVERIIATALDEEITFVDTAEWYAGGESESLIGGALQNLHRRADVVISTKFRRESDPLTAVDESLRRLRTDYVDIYQPHLPSPDVPIESMLRTLTRLIDQGKVRAIGNSNFAGWQIADADWTSRTLGLARFTTAQNRYNLLEREVDRDVLPACRNFGLGLLAWFPLAAGMLTGKYRRDVSPPENMRLSSGPMGAHFLTSRMFDKVELLEAFASESGTDLLSVAVGTLAATEGVASVIMGATDPDQVRANAKAGRWRPSSDQVVALDALLSSS